MKSIILKMFEKIFNCETCVIYARLKKYTTRMDSFSEDCPFCGNLDSAVIEVFENRSVIENKYPYPNTKKHLLIIPDRHIEKYSKLYQKERKELQKIQSKYFDEGFCTYGRQFPNDGASVKHLHIHLIK